MDSTARIFWFFFLLLAAGMTLGDEPPGDLQVDEKRGRISVPAAVAKQGTYEVLKGAVEYVLVSKGGKDYETLFVTEANPEAIRAAFEKVGFEPGAPAAGESPPRGVPVRISAEYEAGGKKVRRAVDGFVLHTRSGKPLEEKPWVYTGSAKSFDPESGKETFQCNITKSVVGLHYTDGSPLLQNGRPEARVENIYKANLEELPAVGTRVRIIFERVAAAIPAGTRRVRVLISGRVQGVGFETFIQREARQLKLNGFVTPLADGRIEAVIEGQAAEVEKLIEKLKRGPRAASVKGQEVKEEPPRGDLSDFSIRNG